MVTRVARNVLDIARESQRLQAQRRLDDVSVLIAVIPLVVRLTDCGYGVCSAKWPRSQRRYYGGSHGLSSVVCYVFPNFLTPYPG